MTNKLRTLVVGVGSIGERHVRCFLSTGRVNVAICEPNDALRDRIADQYGITESYCTCDDAIANQFDAAVIATPAPLHVEQAQALVECGAHVLIEKPLSTKLAGIDELRKSAAANNRLLAVAYPYRAHPSLQAMHAVFSEGRFGEPLQVTVVAGQCFPKYRPAFRDTYYRKRETGGGAIQDALTHLINAVEWFVGPTQWVVGDAERLKLDGVEVEDTAHVMARHNRVLTSYSLNQHQPSNETSLTVVCERAQARFEYHRNRWAWIAEGEESWHEERGGNLERDEIFMRQANFFLDAAMIGSRPLCNLDEAAATLRTVLAVLASLDSRKWEKVTPSRNNRYES